MKRCSRRSSFQHIGLVGIAVSTLHPALTVADVPAGSPYYTDPQESYVEDATSRGIGQVNMIACILSALKPDALVNEGAYIALVDESKCDPERRTSSSNSAATSDGAQAAPAYVKATIESTRASNNDPMIVKGWLELEEEGMESLIFIRMSATEAPSSAHPYGLFRMDFCGTAGDASCMFNGFVEGGEDGLRYYQAETGDYESTVALRLTTAGETSGAGRMLMESNNDSGEFSFAYNQGLFLRSDGNEAQCFSRDATDPDTGFSVWRYGLYDGVTGERVTRNSGFPIEYTTNGTRYQGYLGYYGLSLPPEADALLQDGDTVDKVDYTSDAATRTSYTVVRAPGKLVKYTKQARTLAEMDKIKFTTWVDGNANAFFAGAQPNSQYELYWDAASGSFKVTGQMQCGNNGCQTFDLPQQQTADPNYWSGRGGISGWSQSLGGEVFINLANAPNLLTPANIPVIYRKQDLVYPSDLPGTLHCVQNCPTAATLAAFFTPNTPETSPYVPATYNRWNPAQAADVVTYGTNAASATLRDPVNGAVAFVDAEAFDQHPQYQHGVRTGRLFENLNDVECDDAPGTYCDWKTANLDVYYVWETGPRSWNQFAAVKDASGNFVAFDPPLQVTFEVPGTAGYGPYAGTSLVLQYGGFGDLWGIPGHCVSRNTNQTVSCGDQESRYVPAFVISDDPAVGQVSAGDATYLVKWLNREIRFAKKNPATCAAQGLTAPDSVVLPTAADLRNPADAGAQFYIGAKPDVNQAPRVIHGEVKF